MARSSDLLTVVSARDIDKKVQRLPGISSLVLMENAGRAVAEEAINLLSKDKSKVVMFCGKGNNGGDGFVAARHLLTRGIKPDIFLAGLISEVKGEAKVNLGILLKLKQKITEVRESNMNFVKSKVQQCNLIVDALLGIGLTGEVRGVVRDLIEIINLTRTEVLSVDIPSGLNATSGEVLGSCVKADGTVTFVAKKYGMVTGEGFRYCGKITVRDLGILLRPGVISR